MRRSLSFFAIVVCAILFFAMPEISVSQTDQVTLPNGTSITTSGENGFTSNTYYRDIKDGGGDWRAVWGPPRGRRIIDVHHKKFSDTDFILLDDGSVYEYTEAFVFAAVEFRTKLVSATFSEGFSKLVGDDLYILSSSYVYISHDTAATWSLDSAGLGNAHVWDIALDSAQLVYAATDKGLYSQALNSTTWGKVSSFTLSSNLFKIFVDRKNRIYLGGNGGGTYMSTNNGSTWNFDTSGIGTQSINRFGDDAYGNVYAVILGIGNTPGVAYKSPGGTGAWARIDQGILAITVKSPVFYSVEGDSLLYAGTSFGLFFSTDQGTTWQGTSSHIPAEGVSGFVKGQAGRYFVATGLGIYRRDPADTSWTKSYPVSGYSANLSVAGDRLGNIYAVNGTTTNGGPIVYKSTDNGKVWNPDTAGVSLLRTGVFTIDEAGGQHLGTSQYGSSFTTMMFSKPLGGSWAPDTNGFKSTNLSFTSTMSSDYHGTLYASGYYFSGATQVNGKVLRKPLLGGAWTVDTTAIPSSINYFNNLSPDKSGNMMGFSNATIYRHSAGTWSSFSGPSIAGSFVSSLKISVDSSGALFAATSGSDQHFVSRGLGVYFSTDAGSTWTFAGGDSISFTGLVSYGDTTYGYSQNGLFKFTRKAAAAVGFSSQQTPSSFALGQNFPNPFNPTTVISYQLPVNSFVSLRVYDVIGRVVATLVNKRMNAGTHNVQWNGAGLSSGVYFYQLQAGSFVETKKMVLMK